MSDISKFTSYDEIRAVLGVTDDELEDETLALPHYYHHLSFELSDISDTVEELYLSLESSQSSALSPVEKKFVAVVQLFSAYAIAKNLLTALPLFSPKSITDGRAKTDRFQGLHEDIRDGVDSTYLATKQRLRDLLEALGEPVNKPTLTSPVIAAAVGLDYNPITNL